MTAVELEEPAPAPIIGTWDHELRHEVLPFTIDVVANLLPIGVTVLYADPGVGKSMIAQAVEHGLGHGRPFGPWDDLDPQRCAVIDLEGDPALTQERGFSMSPWGTLATDTDDYDPAQWDSPHGIFHIRDRRTGDFGITGATAAERYLELVALLQQGVDDGKPWGYVRIDTLRDFVGTKPSDTNAYDWDKKWVTELNRLGKHYNCAILLLHHTNKAGAVSGSQGVAGGGECVIHLKENPDAEHPGEYLLHSEKTRRGEPFSYPMRMNTEGVWQFDPSLTAAQVNSAGLCRRIVDFIHARGALTTPEIRSLLREVPTATVKSALGRLQRRKHIRSRRGMWELIGPTPPPAPGPRMGICTVCKERMIVVNRDITTHPGCEPEAPPAPDMETLPAPVEPTARWSGLKAMTRSIDASPFHTVRVVPKAYRDQAPWNLMTEEMDGLFSWRRGSLDQLLVDQAAKVAVLDRRGSYITACGSVLIAPNQLAHSGALSHRGETAGIYLIDGIPWTDERIAHPLGRAAQSTRPDGRIWVTTPHLAKLDKLFAQKLIPRAPAIWDSWTARPTYSLFEKFGEETKAERQRAAQISEEEYNATKESASQAIRLLWPKAARSPIWRPDWRLSIVAESAIRHWSRTYAAVTNKDDPAVLLRMGTTDEADYLAPADAGPDWVPAPLTLGDQFGQMAHKVVKVGRGEEAVRYPSPLTLDTWKARHGVR